MFNVDGSSKGKPGPVGMGGVLRDSNGKVLCMFEEKVRAATPGQAVVFYEGEYVMGGGTIL